MLLKLFICFTVIPLIELYLLIKLGTLIGGLNTILIVICTGLGGAWLAKKEGINTMSKVQFNLRNNIMPTEELIDALIIFIAGLLLITPGLVTDLCGLLLLCPISRARFKIFLKQKFHKFRGNINITHF